MPTVLQTIDEEIAYILANWVQNVNQSITGTIGQNVVYNLATFIKNLPENFQGATVVTAPTINYTTSADDCVIIFTNNSTGGLALAGNRWKKYVIVNVTDNVRTLLNNVTYINLTGARVATISARASVTIALGNDGFYYEIEGFIPTVSPQIIGITGRGRAYDPVTGSSVYEYTGLINKGGADGYYDIYVNSVRMQNYGSNPNFVVVNSAVGLIDISPLTFGVGDSISFNL